MTNLEYKMRLIEYIKVKKELLAYDIFNKEAETEKDLIRKEVLSGQYRLLDRLLDELEQYIKDNK